MTKLVDSDLLQAIKEVPVPGSEVALGNVAQVKVSQGPEGEVRITIELGFPANSVKADLEAAVRAALSAREAAGTISFDWRLNVIPHSVQRNLKPLDGVRNVIAVASGKGGVGKSTTSVNLALALAAEGARVGVLDADIYGPSQPAMLGIAAERPVSKDGKSMEPLQAHGVQVMSIGFLIDVDQPMVWRGPMVTQALNQLLLQTNWDDLDYLIVDMPPGTGDIQLTLTQQVPVSGAVIVTTPQDIALLDARKGLQMFKKVAVPVLGIVENMSTHICSQCGHEEPLFGTGGGERLATDYDVELLGQLPLDLSIREETDSGNPSVIADPDSAIAAAYRDIARKTAMALAGKARDYSHRFPNIVVEGA